MDKPVAYAVGIVSASVCYPNEMPLDDVLDWMNLANPTGLAHGWVPSTDHEFAGGEPNPCPCNTDPSRTHRLLHC